MQARARLQFNATFLADGLQATGVIQREAQAIYRTLEQQQQPVGPINQASAPLLLEFQYQAVVLAE